MTTSSCRVVLGELLLQPSSLVAQKRRTPLTTFFRNSSSRKRRKSTQRISALPLLPSFSPDALGLRCGGFGFAEGEDDGGGDVERDTTDGSPSSSSSQILVDASVTESENSSLADNEENVADVDPSSGLENDDGSESDTNSEDSGHIEARDGINSSKEDISSSDEDEESCVVEESDNSDTDSVISDSLTTSLQQIEVAELRSSASDRRAEGKSLHDGGNLNEAAKAFHEAASLLDEAIAVVPSAGGESDMVVERATCRLHEALCLFKDGRPGECVNACTDVLEDGVMVVPSEAEEANEDDDTGNGNDSIPSPVIQVIPAAAALATKSVIPSQIRARAHHRRAKARLVLGDLDGALEDARSAAFMGDRNAVQFYGRLLREGSGAAGGGGDSALSSTGGFPFGLSEGSGVGGGTSSNPFLEGILGGLGGSGGSGSLMDALMPSAGAGSSDFSSSLLSSLLGSGNGEGGDNNSLGLLGSFLSPPPETTKGKARKRGKKKKRGGGGGMDTLAKSVLTSLVKRIEDVETQELICSYLKSTNTQQIMQLSNMAGVPLQLKSAQRLVTFAAGVTPEGISKSVSRVKRGISIFKTVRKALKVIDEYKGYIIVAVICYWIRSAVRQPYVMSAKQTRKIAQKAALSLVIAPSSGRSLGSLRDGTLRALSELYSSCTDDTGGSNGGISKTSIEEELEQLQNQLSLIGALEERNKAQLGSFVDEEDQWDSLEEEERVFLRSKGSVIQQMEYLTEQLVMSFMGQKMMDG